METGQTELDIRVTFLERRSWVKKAKARDDTESFSLEISGNQQPLPTPALTPTTLVQAGWGQRQGEGRKPSGSPMVPRPLSQLLHALPHAWVPFLHSHSRVHAHTYISHTLLVTQSQPGLFSCGTEAGQPQGQVQRFRTGEVGAPG